MGQFIFFDDDGRTVAVEDFPNRLLLGQDQAPLRCRRIDGHDQDDHVAAGNEVADDGYFVFIGFQAGQFFFELMNARSRQGADPDGIFFDSRRFPRKISFIIDDEIAGPYSE